MALPVEMYLSDKLHLSKRSLDVNTDTSQQSQQQGDTKPDDGAKALVSKLETFFWKKNFSAGHAQVSGEQISS